MTNDELIRKLADDLDITRARMEDILVAQRDLCEAELRAGRSFLFYGVGALCQRNERESLRFEVLPKLRDKLGVRQTVKGPLCQICNRKPRLPRRRACGACRVRNYRKKKIGGSNG